MSTLFKLFSYLSLALVVLTTSISARADIVTSSEYVMIMDHDTGDTLYEKNADLPMKPASMAKIMTVYLLFEQLKRGDLAMSDEFIVSEKAWKKGGSRTFLEPGSKVSVSDLLRGIIVQSGNDAAIVVAEGIAGTEDAFAELMTNKAAELGMENTVFGNSTGWPDNITTTTARDLAILGRAIITNFPEHYPMFAESSFTYNKITQPNRNPLIYGGVGADGLKTGHTEASGYGLVGSAMRGNQRVLMVLNGMSSIKERKNESIRLMDLTFRMFKKQMLVNQGDVVGYTSVWMGERGVVPLTVNEDISKVMDKASLETMTKRVDWPSYISAPISEGQEIGRLTLTISGQDYYYPLVAAEDVPDLSFYRYPGAYFHYLIFGLESKSVKND
ncbi:MAG TPA: D-alanyl-D-alanine carboxypeptidase [Alphaproteobacteria bacterium]|nr:D-alanyl-D-alanine carboxypeptidase [Alphaproteobacteria bacterium]|tara:strand:+ start:1037 stop:2197 length:1161 start_codon:yes stop_codon:yes gene_type:complete